MEQSTCFGKVILFCNAIDSLSLINKSTSRVQKEMSYYIQHYRNSKNEDIQTVDSDMGDIEGNHNDSAVLFSRV